MTEVEYELNYVLNVKLGKLEIATIDKDVTEFRLRGASAICSPMWVRVLVEIITPTSRGCLKLSIKHLLGVPYGVYPQITLQPGQQVGVHIMYPDMPWFLKILNWFPWWACEATVVLHGSKYYTREKGVAT